MVDGSNYKTKDYVLFILGLLGYFAAVMVPAVLLALHFPKYGLWIFVFGAILCFAGPGFMIGLEWNASTIEMKKSLKHFGITILWLMLLITVMDMISQHTRIDTFGAVLGIFVLVALCTLAAFHLGNTINMHRTEVKQ